MNIIIFIKTLVRILFASPWTPPASMKSNGSTNGGSLNIASYGDYADHLLNFANFMSSNAAPLYAISVQNEPDFLATYESCLWSATEMLNFVDQQGAKFTDIKLILAESMNFNQSLTDPILNSATAEPLVDIIGTHIYGGGIADYALARTKGKEIWMTEHFIENSDWTSALATGKEIHDCMVVNFNAYICWYIRRNIGLIAENGDITEKGYVMSQYSKFVRPGYKRIGATVSSAPNVDVTAFKTDSSIVIVALNRNSVVTNVNFAIQNFSVDSLVQYTSSGVKSVINDSIIDVSGGVFSVSLDAQSITTFTSLSYGGIGENTPPVANAGADQEVTDSDNNGTEIITFDGSASTDTDGTIINYSWSEAGIQIASGISPSVAIGTGVHNIVLTVTDNFGAINKDTLIVTVNLIIPEVHIYLEAECGAIGSTWNKFINTQASNNLYMMVQGVNSTGSASVNATGHISYNFETTDTGIYRIWGRTRVPSPDDDSYWVRVDGSSWINWNGITGGTSWTWDDVHDGQGAPAMSYNLDSGPHVLTIAYREDGAGLDKIYITNTGTIPAGLGNDANNCPATAAPVANAGIDQTLTDDDGNGAEAVLLSSAGSSDSDGLIMSYIWSESGSQIAATANPNISLNVGIHSIILTVADNNSETDSDTVLVSVIQNVAPIADAGTNIIITDSDNNGSEPVKLDGTGSSDADGSIVSYIWTESDTVAEAGSATINLTTGAHKILLTVTDNGGATDTNSVFVTIIAPDAVKTISLSDNISFFPNPVKDELFITISGISEKPCKIDIFDGLGMIVRQVNPDKETTMIKTIDLSEGLYFIKISIDGNTITRKFIKQ